MKKKPKIPRAVIGTVLVFVVLLSVFMAGHDLWRQKQAQDTFEDLADLVTAPEDPEESQAESSAPEEFAEAQEPQEEQRNLSLLFGAERRLHRLDLHPRHSGGLSADAHPGGF